MGRSRGAIWALGGAVLVGALLVLGAGFAGSAAAQDEEGGPDLAGSGTPEDPYVITTVDELQAVNEDPRAHYALGNDIDASETETWNAGNGFEPIGSDDPFTGTFDGRGHEIDGLTIIRPGTDNVGLFAFSQGTIENVSLDGATINGANNVGALVGVNQGYVRAADTSGEIYAAGSPSGGLIGVNEGRVLASYSEADVEGETTVGGLVGASDGPIRGSYAAGSATGSDLVGGLVGDNSNAITASYAVADVEADTVAGSLVGQNDGTVKSSYAAGPVTADDLAGGLLGQNSGTVVDAYWDVPVTGFENATGQQADVGTGLTTREMTGNSAESNLDGFDMANIWMTTDDYPVHQWEADDVSPSDQWQIPTPTPAPTTAAPTTNATADTATPTPTSGDGPGFGPLAALAALVLGVITWRDV